MTRCLVLLIALSFAATVAQGDEWDDAMAVPGTVAAVPEHLWFPYVSTYYVKPIVTTAETLRVGYYVTDWNQSEVRADDQTRRFDLTLEVWRDDEIVRTLAATNAPAGDGGICPAPLGEGPRERARVASRAAGVPHAEGPDQERSAQVGFTGKAPRRDNDEYDGKTRDGIAKGLTPVVGL